MLCNLSLKICAVLKESNLKEVNVAPLILLFNYQIFSHFNNQNLSVNSKVFIEQKKTLNHIKI